MVAAPLIFHKRVPWHPVDIPRSVFKEWWNADLLPAGAVTTWTGAISGTAPTQGTAGLRPVASATSFPGGYGGVTFDGVDDTLRTTSFAALPQGGTQGEIWSVYSPSSLAAIGTILSYGNAAATLRRQLFSSAGKAQSSDGTTSVSSTTTFAANAIIVHRSKFETALLTGQANGDVQTTSVSGTLNTGAVRMALGANIATTASGWFSGVLRHAMVFAGPLSNSDAQKLMAWCLWDVGQQALLPSTNPYKLFRP